MATKPCASSGRRHLTRLQLELHRCFMDLPSRRKGFQASGEDPEDDERSRLLDDEEKAESWRVVSTVALHEEIEVNSSRVGKLAPGEVVLVTQTQRLPSGLVRLHCRDRGWVTQAPHLIERIDGAAAGGGGRCSRRIALRGSALAAVVLVVMAVAGRDGADAAPRLSSLSVDMVPDAGKVTFDEIMALFPPGDSLSGDTGHSGTCANLKEDLSGIEQEVFCTLGTFTPPDSLVVDGGAHWGETLRLMELSLEDTVEIHSFEAIRGNVRKIAELGVVETCERCPNRTTVVQAALTTEPDVTEVTIQCAKRDCMDGRATLSSAVVEKRKAKAKNAKTYPQVVPAVRLAEYLAELEPRPSQSGWTDRVPAVYTINLDLEGTDFETLQTLDYRSVGSRHDHPTVLMWQASPGTSNRPLLTEAEWLIERGYAVFRLTPAGLVPVLAGYKSAHECFRLIAIRQDAEGFRDNWPDHWSSIDSCLNRTAGVELTGRDQSRPRHRSAVERLRFAQQHAGARAAAEKGHKEKGHKPPARHSAAANADAAGKPHSGGGSGGSGGSGSSSSSRSGSGGGSAGSSSSRRSTARPQGKGAKASGGGSGSHSGGGSRSSAGGSRGSSSHGSSGDRHQSKPSSRSRMGGGGRHGG
jgi:hypothetical protein